ncbi:CD1375 family protein [Jeotgalibacillus malaysiensis]
MFTSQSRIVQDYVLLIKEGRRTIDQVPDYQNLRQVVSDVLAA